MSRKDATLRQILSSQMLPWMIGATAFSLLLSSGIALINLRVLAESNTVQQLQATVKAFRSDILGGQIRNVEIQVKSLLNLSESDRVQIVDPELHAFYQDSFDQYIWPSELKSEGIHWISLVRLNVLVPIYFDQENTQLFGYLALNQAPQFQWLIFYLVFGSLMAAQVLFILLYRKGILNIGQQLSSQLARVEAGFSNRAIQAGPDESQKIFEVEAIRSAFQQIQSQIKNAGSGTKSLAQVAHDIRSPLTALSIGLKTLKLVPPETRQLLETAFARVETIANDILTANRKSVSAPEPNARALSFSKFEASIRKLIDEKKLEHKHKAIEWNVAFNAENSIRSVAADLPNLLRSLSNLLNNAADASPHNSVVSFRSKINEQALEIEISDSGPGIPIEEHCKILSGGFSTKPNGNGLGISSAKSFVENIGGNLLLVNEQTGLTVKLIIPLVGDVI